MTRSPRSILSAAAKSAKREWPFAVGIFTLVLAHIMYYGFMENEWRIGGPPLFLAIAVLFIAELARQLLKRYQE